MEIPKLVYNVIWVDDEIDTLIDMGTKRCLISNGIRIIPAHSAIELREVMEISYDRIDAVITDANMPKHGDKPKGEKDLSGFEDVKSCIEKYNQKRDIPFYLYSGRGEYLSERYENEGLEYFEINDRIFSKGELPQLLEQLRKDVEHINSPSFRIRNKYRKELEAAKAIEGNEETLFQALLYDYSEDWGNTQDYFNPARKVVERIFDACKRREIIPQLTELNSFSGFLLGKDSVFAIKENCEIMPKPLVHSLEYFLNITQDGSHGAGDLRLGVDEYVRTSKNINLFRTILYIAMDLCLWYQKVSEYSGTENRLKWQLKPDYCFEYTGVVKKIDGKLVCGECLLQDKEVEYTEGDEVGIKLYKGKALRVNNSPFEYDDGEKKISVSKYAFANNVVIIKKNN
jgi:hypothetical protein